MNVRTPRPWMYELAAGTRPKLAELARSYVETVLDEHGGCITRAAKALGIGRATLYRQVKAKRDRAAVER